MKALRIEDDGRRFNLLLDDYRIDDVVSYRIDKANYDDIARLTVTVLVRSVNRLTVGGSDKS